MTDTLGIAVTKLGFANSMMNTGGRPHVHFPSESFHFLPLSSVFNEVINGATLSHFAMNDGKNARFRACPIRFWLSSLTSCEPSALIVMCWLMTTCPPPLLILANLSSKALAVCRGRTRSPFQDSKYLILART